MIEFKCQQCGEAMSAPTSLSRGTETCPSCGHVCRVPNVYLGPIAFKDVPILGRLWSRWTLGIVGVIVTLIVALLIVKSDLTDGVEQKRRFPPATFAEWSKTFETAGWRLEKDSTTEGNAIFPDLRWVTYTKVFGDLELGATMSPSLLGGETIDDLYLSVEGPFENKTPVLDGLRECRLMAMKLIPQSDIAVVSAMRSAQQIGNKNFDVETGVKRLEGQASTPDGWKVTVCVYLIGLKDRSDTKAVMTFTKNSEVAKTNGASNKIAISSIGHRRVNSYGEFVTVAWKATVRNRNSKTMRVSVEAVFIDMQRFELAHDSKYGIVLSPGESRVVTGTVPMMKSGIYKSVANLLIKVRGYPV